MRQATLHIEGMTCAHCLNAVTRALNSLPGVQVETVRIGRAEVSYDEQLTGLDRLEAAVAEAGYRAAVQQ